MDQNEKAFQKQVSELSRQFMAVMAVMGHNSKIFKASLSGGNSLRWIEPPHGSARTLCSSAQSVFSPRSPRRQPAANGRRWETVVTSYCVLFVSHRFI